jgi:hypothetical protein
VKAAARSVIRTIDSLPESNFTGRHARGRVGIHAQALGANELFPDKQYQDSEESNRSKQFFGP